MKTYTFFLMLLGTFLLTACSKNNDAVTPSLVGKWQFLTATFIASANGQSGTRTDNYSGQDASYEFKSDGTYTGRTPDSTATGGVTTLIENGTYKLADSQITLTRQDPSTKAIANSYANYTLNGSSLTFTITKELLLKTLNEQAATDPFAQLSITEINKYTAYTVTLTMQRQ